MFNTQSQQTTKDIEHILKMIDKQFKMSSKHSDLTFATTHKVLALLEILTAKQILKDEDLKTILEAGKDD
tara:strand:+ start:6076 stop:6285 length:210 start_codon:yes stop_codon:yes gene_type:complete